MTNRTCDVFLIGNSSDEVHQEYCYDTPVMHGRACYYPPLVGLAGQRASDLMLDPLTGARKEAWRVEQERRGY